MKNSSSTTLSIESRQGIYGICCFPYLACLGCFPLRLKDTIRLTWLFMGKKKKRGGLLPYTYSGQFGRKEIVNRLKMRSILFKG